MNKWQKYYLKKHFGGTAPTDETGKKEIRLLEKCGSAVTVHFPDFSTKRYVNGSLQTIVIPKHTDTYTITEDECDILNGKISVQVLTANLILWTARGYQIDFT